MRTGGAHELEEVTWPSSTLARLFSTDTSTMTPASAVNAIAVGAVFLRRRRRIEDRSTATNRLMAVDIKSGAIRYLADEIGVKPTGYRDCITGRLATDEEQAFFGVVLQPIRMLPAKALETHQQHALGNPDGEEDAGDDRLNRGSPSSVPPLSVRS
jgi:hypothetical protein